MKLIRTFRSESVQDSKQIAEILSGMFKPGDLILLDGNLGSGKTFLVDHICRNWNLQDNVTSPTFTIINQYTGPIRVNHMDFYRINDPKELDHLGWEELQDDHSVTFVEWPQWIEPLVDDYYKILIIMEGEQRIFEVYHTE